MKKRKHHKFIAFMTALSLIGSCAVINANAASAKVNENVIAAIESGAENIEVCLRYKDIDAVEITFKAKELSYEYAETLDKSEYSDEEIERLRFDYYVQLNEEMYADARNERTASILSELGVNPENAVCEYGYPKITCTLSPEQIEIAENMELITGIVLKSDWKTSSDLGYTASDADVKVLQNTLEQLVAEDTEFRNNSFIYSDKYKFALESGEERDTLIVYGIPAEDCYGEWKYHVVVNPDFTYTFENWFPAGENRSVYSGFKCNGVISKNSSFKLERNLDVMFFVENEIPYYAETVEDASEKIGYDISPYIYSEGVPATEPETNPTGTTVNIPDAEMYGDVNLDKYVNASDVVAINLYLLSDEKYPLCSTALANADCFRDNVINTDDSTLLLSYLAQLVTYDELGK